MTEREYQRIRLQGVAARQGGKSSTANPYAGKASMRRQADAWDSGWSEANMAMRAKR